MNAKITALRRRHGVAIVFVAMVLFVLLGFIGFMLDQSYVFLVGHQLQNGADAAALAGAAVVESSTTNAAAAAIEAGADNTVAGTSLVLTAADVQTGNYNLSTSTFTANGTPTNAVQVTAHRSGAANAPSPPIKLIFGPMYGVFTSNVTRQATAMAGGGFGIIALDPTRQNSFQAQGGNASVDVTGGGIQVDSDNSKAVNVSGGAKLTAAELNVVGGVNTSGGSTISGTENLGAASVTDPLASLPEPSSTGLTNYGSENLNSSATLQPGYYPGGIQTNGNSTLLTLTGGLYVIGPPGLKVQGGSSLVGTGVTIFLTNTPSNPNQYGTLDISASSISLSPPTSGPYDGITIFQDRNTPYNANSDTVSGSGTMNISGTIYAPSTGLNVTGAAASLANEIIADTFNVSGSGTINISFKAPAVQSAAVFLVR